MIRKIIASILLVVGILVALVLLTYGGPVFPHILGPAILTVTGLALLVVKK